MSSSTARDYRQVATRRQRWASQRRIASTIAFPNTTLVGHEDDGIVPAAVLRVRRTLSDALALAVRSNAPIFAADKVIEESGIEFEHEVEDTDEVVEKFKEFLDQVSPDDFMTEG